ncbi:lipoate--protein ligase family protein [Candidatus Woesearchaeota archaeon]|nr:lipoate--protein ligase family protein [Candidatus Woesearchaeota archaeon]
MKLNEWRLIDLEKENGLFNTNLDQAIKEEIELGNSGPTILFTEWEPTVSIGRSESLSKDVNLEACTSHNVGVVRRLSGGNSVYLDDGYLVFSIIAPMNTFYDRMDKTGLCRDICDAVVSALRKLNIPAEFHKPDNVIVRNGKGVQTIGNSGQRIGEIFYAHGSIRYELKNFDVFLDVLKVNGYPIHRYHEEIRSVLGEVISFNSKINKEDIKKELALSFSERYGIKLRKKDLTDREIERVELIGKEQERDYWLRDEETYKTKGICYLFLDGTNLVPSLHPILPYSKPSPPEEGSELHATT